MQIDDARFPTEISRGCIGGPERRTEVVTLASGHEQRNARWADSRRRYNAGYGIKSLNDLDIVIHFFEERRGRLHAFRWRDPFDYKSCKPENKISALDQNIGMGDGKTKQFQLVKHYGSGIRNHIRQITKPAENTLKIAVNGHETKSFSLDSHTGIVSFFHEATPLEGAIITAGYLFDVPARFDTDKLSVNLQHFNAGEIPDIPIIEVRV